MADRYQELLDKYGDWDSEGTPNQQSPSTDRYQALIDKYGEDPNEVMVRQPVNTPQRPIQASQGPKMPPADPSLIGFSRAVEEPVEGLVQLGAQGLGKLGVPTEGFLANLKRNREAKQAEYERAKQQQPVGTRLGYATGLVGAVASTPAGKMGLLKGMGMGAGYAGAQWADSAKQRITNALVGAGAGMLFPAVGKAGKLIGKGIRAIKPTASKAVKDVSTALTPDDLVQMKSIKEAAKRLDTHVTFGEASGNPFVRGLEGRITPNAKLQREANKLLGTRGKEHAKMAKKFIQSVVSEGDDVADAKMKTLYNEATKYKIPASKIQKIHDDPILNANFKAALRDPNSTMAQLPENSVAKYHKLKQFMDYEITKQSKESIVKRDLLQAKDKLVDILDDTAPSYKAARQISHRLKTKAELTDELRKIKLLPGQESPTPDQIYDKLLSTPDKRKIFLDAIKLGGGNTQQAKDFITVLNAISKSPMSRFVTRDPSLKSVQFGGDPLARASEQGLRMLRGKYNKEVFNLALDPKWETKVKALADKVDEGEIVGVIDETAAMLSKMSGQAIGTKD